MSAATRCVLRGRCREGSFDKSLPVRAATQSLNSLGGRSLRRQRPPEEASGYHLGEQWERGLKEHVICRQGQFRTCIVGLLLLPSQGHLHRPGALFHSYNPAKYVLLSPGGR